MCRTPKGAERHDHHVRTVADLARDNEPTTDPWIVGELATAVTGSLDNLSDEVQAVLEGERAKATVVDAIAQALARRCPMVLSNEAWVGIARGHVIQACVVADSKRDES